MDLMELCPSKDISKDEIACDILKNMRRVNLHDKVGVKEFADRCVEWLSDNFDQLPLDSRVEIAKIFGSKLMPKQVEDVTDRKSGRIVINPERMELVLSRMEELRRDRSLVIDVTVERAAEGALVLQRDQGNDR